MAELAIDSGRTEPSGGQEPGEVLLSVRGLTVDVPSAGGWVRVVDGIDLDVPRRQVVGVAGESGSGKTMALKALLGLAPPGSRLGGRALFEGRDLLSLGRGELRSVRGRQIAMVFQDPTTSLHPMLSIGTQLTDHLKAHFGMSRAARRRRAIELLSMVRIPDPEGALRAYSHQFSGGMRQRIAIAVALACDPKLLIADEPTTALDVTVQAGVLGMLDRLRRDSDVSIVLITHDLGVMSALADQVYVCYSGRLIETGPAARVLTAARHPYTAGLLAALPHSADSDGELVPIPGTPPSPAARPGGCAFHPRCQYAVDICREQSPALVRHGPQIGLACHEDPFA